MEKKTYIHNFCQNQIFFYTSGLSIMFIFEFDQNMNILLTVSFKNSTNK